ncbi:MAG: hypothetical protein MJ239_07415 [Bacilli bacterium]|nr:hypothetical protein [Bacilli bacterium]
MKKPLIVSSFAVLMLVTSCGGKGNESSASTLDPVKPSVTYTDPDEADKDSGNSGSNEPVIVEGSPYTQEELYFGDRVFGKDFLDANSSEVQKPSESDARITEWNFDKNCAHNTATAMYGKYYGGMYRPFSLITEEETFMGSSEKPFRMFCAEVGDLYHCKDTLVNGGNYSLIDGYGNRLLNTSQNGYLAIMSATFTNGYLAHDESDPCMPISCLRLQYRLGTSSSNYTEYDKAFIYMDTVCTTSVNYDPSIFCKMEGQHQLDDITGLELPKHSLDQYGKHGWYYTLNDGHYRFYNEENKIVSAISTKYENAVAEYSTSWFSANHLNIQVTYLTDDKHNYTFAKGDKYYVTNHFIFEYTSGKTYQVRDLNYVVFNTADMKYSNTYYDFTLADIRFVSNKTLLEFDYSFLVDKDLVLRDDVTDLISSGIHKTDNYYYSEAKGDYTFFDKTTGIHTLSVDKTKVTNLYPNNEFFSYKAPSGDLGLVGFNGKYLFNANFDYFAEPSCADGYRYLIGRKSGTTDYYMLDTKEFGKTYIGKGGTYATGVWNKYYLFENNAYFYFYDLSNGETVKSYSKAYLHADTSSYGFVIDGTSICSKYSYKLFRFVDEEGGVKVVKFGEKLVCKNNQNL